MALGNLSIYAITAFHNVRYVMLTAIILTMFGAHGVAVLVQWLMLLPRFCRSGPHSPPRTRRTQSFLIFLCALCGLSGEPTAVLEPGTGVVQTRSIDRRLAVRVICGAILILAAGSVLNMGLLAARNSYCLRVSLRHKEWYEAPWRYEAMRYLDREMPPDAILVSGMPGPYVDHYLLRGTARLYMPIKHKGADYSSRPPGRAWPVADEQPEMLEAAIKQGKSVYLLTDPSTLQSMASLDFLRSRFAFREVGTLTTPGADPQTLYRLAVSWDVTP